MGNRFSSDRSFREEDNHENFSKAANYVYKPLDLVRDAYEKWKKWKEVKTESSESEIGHKYLTDQGNLIPIEVPIKPVIPSNQVPLAEHLLRLWFEEKQLPVKQLSNYDLSFNCHGYTFTNGEASYRIDDPDVVEKIIKENGFRQVASANNDGSKYICKESPKEGDIIIYRDSDNEIVHSGVIVRSNENSNHASSQKLGKRKANTLVESGTEGASVPDGQCSQATLPRNTEKVPKNITVRSKIGEFGIYEHPINFPDLPISLDVTHWEIYHTDRPQGRFINGVSKE